MGKKIELQEIFCCMYKNDVLNTRDEIIPICYRDFRKLVLGSGLISTESVIIQKFEQLAFSEYGRFASVDKDIKSRIVLLDVYNILLSIGRRPSFNPHSASFSSIRESA